MTVLDDVAALNATATKAIAAKKQLTTNLTTLVAKFNDPATPRAVLSASLSVYVMQFDALTVQTNALWAGLAQLTTDAQPAPGKASIMAADLVAQAGATSPVLTIKVAVPIVTTGFVATKGDATRPMLKLN